MCLTEEPEVPCLMLGLGLTFISSSSNLRRAVVSYRQKYVHLGLVNCLGALSLTRNNVGRLTDRLDMTTAVYHGC